MVSLRGYLLDIRTRIIIVSIGDGIGNKMKLIFHAILDSTPNTLKRMLPFFKHFIDNAKEKLAKTIKLNLNGNRFCCVDSESIRILFHYFERWMWNYLKLRKGDVFLDVGAHVGKYTIQMAKVVGKNGRVIAVEPHPENYKTLLENIRLNGLTNITAVNIAAWNEKVMLKLFNGRMRGHNSIKNNFGLGYVTVEALPLDDLLSELEVKKVDYIKIDVEKSELEVLEGLTKTLRNHHPTVIVEVVDSLNSIKRLPIQLGYEIEPIPNAPDYYILKPVRIQQKLIKEQLTAKAPYITLGYPQLCDAES